MTSNHLNIGHLEIVFCFKGDGTKISKWMYLIGDKDDQHFFLGHAVH